MSPGAYQKFAIFVVEILDGNTAEYKPCAQFEGRFHEQQVRFECNSGDGQTGQFVYIRDDRVDRWVVLQKLAQFCNPTQLFREYFGLCEVQVFQRSDTPQCGQPEVYQLILLWKTYWTTVQSLQSFQTLRSFQSTQLVVTGKHLYLRSLRSGIHLGIRASTHLCLRASIHLCLRASTHLCQEQAHISASEQAHISTLEQAHMINNNWLMIIGSSLQPVDPPDGLLLCPVLLQPGLHTDRRQDQELYTTWLDRPGASL